MNERFEIASEKTGGLYAKGAEAPSEKTPRGFVCLRQSERSLAETTQRCIRRARRPQSRPIFVDHARGAHEGRKSRDEIVRVETFEIGKFERLKADTDVIHDRR